MFGKQNKMLTRKSQTDESDPNDQHKDLKLIEAWRKVPCVYMILTATGWRWMEI